MRAGDDTSADTSAEQDGAVLEDSSALLDGQDAASQETTAQYVATATVTIKVRRQPSTDSYGNGSIPEVGSVYVLQLGDEWSLVVRATTLAMCRSAF